MLKFQMVFATSALVGKQLYKIRNIALDWLVQSLPITNEGLIVHLTSETR